jgi:hypothetical protein
MAHLIMGFVVFGEPLVVAHAAAVLADPGEGPLDDPAAGQYLERVRVALADDLDGQAQDGCGPAGQLAGVGGVSPGQADAAVPGPSEQSSQVAALTAACGSSADASRIVVGRCFQLVSSRYEHLPHPDLQPAVLQSALVRANLCEVAAELIHVQVLCAVMAPLCVPGLG